MAKRRDRNTRRYKNLERKYGEEGKKIARDEIRDRNRINARNQVAMGGKPQSPDRGLISGMKGPSRQLGRRGVRARARNSRIMARQANGTYRQPSGGVTTNS